MAHYGNQSGDSPVSGFQAGRTFIDVHFRGAGTYRYSYARPGRDHVEHMKALARQGVGLATYISRYVRDDYESKRG
jgi:hypothetical protein